ncbi:hypothetical protein OROGR_029570 [Orobanche gracilis]
MRTKHLCRVGVSSDDVDVSVEEDMATEEEEQSVLEEQTVKSVEELKLAIAYHSLLETAWCLTNIAAGKPEETKALLPALPLLIAHMGEKSSLPVAEQCAWALGNVAGEGEELRDVLLI